MMEDNYIKVADELCPGKSFKVSKDRPEYFTNKISQGISRRDYLFLKARCCTNKKKAKQLWVEAIAKRREVRQLLRNAKRNYVTNKFKENKNNPKKYWRYMNRFLNKTRSNGQITEIVADNNEKKSGLEAAEMINRFFCGIGTNLANKIVPTDRSFNVTEVDSIFVWEFNLTESEVISEIEKLDPSKSSGLPRLSNKILKILLRQDVCNFTRLLNSCIKRGIFPRNWKRAIVVPIPKGDKSKTLGNIRPISLIPAPSKIFERLIYNRVYTYLQGNNLFSAKEAGFRRYYSVHDSLIDLIDFINRSFNEGKFVLCIYADLAKAFNSLNNSILINNLDKLGFKSNVLELLKSYTSGRAQVTNMNGYISESGFVEYRVAQGSVLGPLLFSLYMNDLPTIFKVLNVRMYADYTALFFCFRCA